MACEQYLSHDWQQVPATMANSEKLKPCFDCNICLDFASEPIITLCGHLYCWPCIYNWLHVQSASIASDVPPQCPVCRADISPTKMVPLYGRGQSVEHTEFDTKGLVIPPRPSACGSKTRASIRSIDFGQQLLYQNPNQNYDVDLYNSYEDDSGAWSFDLDRDLINSFHHSMVGMLVEMVLGRMFGHSESLYAYVNSDALSETSSPQLRRQEMQAEKSLNRISIFLFCCFMLYLIIF